MDIARWGLQETSLGTSVRSYGGRFSWNDCGETANAQVCLHNYPGGKRIVFEVRNMPTEKLDGAGVGVIFYGSEGKLVIASYNGGIAYDTSGKEVKKFSGGEESQHYENFVQAVRKRDHTLLNADILDGHLSSALCHLGNISYRLGAPITSAELQKSLGDDQENQSTLDRFLHHLVENKVDPVTTKITSGPTLDLSDHETFTGPRAEEANKLLTREYRAPYIVPKTEDL
jgi:hypothetical protein